MTIKVFNEMVAKVIIRVNNCHVIPKGGVLTAGSLARCVWIIRLEKLMVVKGVKQQLLAKNGINILGYLIGIVDAAIQRIVKYTLRFGVPGLGAIVGAQDIVINEHVPKATYCLNKENPFATRYKTDKGEEEWVTYLKYMSAFMVFAASKIWCNTLLSNQDTFTREPSSRTTGTFTMTHSANCGMPALWRG